MNTDSSAVFANIVKKVLEYFPKFSFQILEIGAVPLTGTSEPFHRLLDDFAGSRIHAFELDPGSCEALRHRARPGIEIHSVGIGRRSERRTLYLTKAAMCSSLYRPNDPLLSRFHNMDVASLRDTANVETVSIDDFTRDAGIPRIDFVKIDIQGAELDAF
jgi:FkbM family methyltransferase